MRELLNSCLRPNSTYNIVRPLSWTKIQIRRNASGKTVAHSVVEVARARIWEGSNSGASTLDLLIRSPQANAARRQRQDKRARNGIKQIESCTSDVKDQERSTLPRPQFSPEEISGEARRPKRKVAVLLGYAGTGYKGMQM